LVLFIFAQGGDMLTSTKYYRWCLFFTGIDAFAVAALCFLCYRLRQQMLSLQTVVNGKLTILQWTHSLDTYFFSTLSVMIFIMLCTLLIMGLFKKYAKHREQEFAGLNSAQTQIVVTTQNRPKAVEKYKDYKSMMRAGMIGFFTLQCLLSMGAVLLNLSWYSDILFKTTVVLELSLFGALATAAFLCCFMALLWHERKSTAPTNINGYEIITELPENDPPTTNKLKKSQNTATDIGTATEISNTFQQK